jgi:hypothetical protein
MWLVLTRAPHPDAPYWPGRRLLAMIDAVLWPAAWIVAVNMAPMPLGVIGQVVAAIAVVAGLARVWRAVVRNERYRFATWRWGRGLVALAVIGVVLRSMTLV